MHVRQLEIEDMLFLEQVMRLLVNLRLDDRHEPDRCENLSQIGLHQELCSRRVLCYKE